MRLEDLKGRRVGRYEILEVLGRGGMAAVYRARDTVLRRDVALKILYPQYTGDVALVERFQREAVLAASLDHPNILPIYDVGDEDGLVYIAMRLLSGQSFADLLRLRGALPTDELLPIIDQVAAALDYAHARQIVHRDIKPANILIEGADASDLSGARAILTDFGIAKSLDSAASGITATGVLIGTPEYMAPEQIRGSNSVDARADIYALGVLAYRALTGRRPFEGSTEEVLLGHLHGTAQRPSSIATALPPAIDEVIRRVLARDPAQRYQSAGEFARALRSAAGLEAPTPPPALRRSGDGRVVVPNVALGELGGQAASNGQPTRRAAAPVRRPPVLAPPQPARRGSSLAWMLLGLVLALVIGGGTLYAVGLLGPRGAQPPSPAPTEQPSALPAPTSQAAAPTAEPTAQPTAAPTAEPSAQPTEAATPAPTVAPTEAPTRAPTVAPTKAPTKAPTVAPTTAPTITPTPGCPAAIGDEFAGLLAANPTLQARIGCGAQARQVRDLAEQPFERGAMLWLAGPQGSNGTIYVIESAPKPNTAITWESYEDTWQSGDPEDNGDRSPPAGLIEPVRGFGKVWYSNQALADALGWASAAERAGTGATQRFDNARLIYSPLGYGAGPTIFVFYQDGSLQVYPAAQR